MKLPLLSLLAAFAVTAVSFAQDAVVLFDGDDLSKWRSASNEKLPENWVAKDGTLTREGKGGDIWTKERFGNFVLELEFKTTGNSGIFIRTDNPKDPVQTGIEVQVDKPADPTKHSVGALYDLVPPNVNAAKDDWNKVVISARGPLISVELNGKIVSEMNLDQWTEAEKNPDGSKNKFKKPLKEFKREGHIGLQDHGKTVSYRNIKVKPLDSR